MVSLHADGAASSAHGFHVIAPQRRSPWTTDIAASSLRLAKSLRDGSFTTGYPGPTTSAGGSGLDVRGDLGTLNMSDVPVAMVEIGNMRNVARRAPDDDAGAGQARYAKGGRPRGSAATCTAESASMGRLRPSGTLAP